MARLQDAPVRAARMLTPSAIVSTAPDGTLYVRAPQPLGPYPEKLTACLDRWADAAPDRTFLAARDAAGAWRRLAYADARPQVRAIAQAFLDRGLSADRPLVILSGNGLEHAVLALAAMYAGVLYAPVAPAYALLSRDYRTLQAIWRSMRPALVFAAEGPRFAPALASLEDDAAEIVTCDPIAPSDASGRRITPFAELLATPVTSAVDDAHARVGPETIAKILFTSGSTGAPKGVINTQRMLCANQEQLRAAMTFLADEPPVFCDWLPWNHTFGGNHNVGLTLYNGGTLYIDDGKPAPGQFAPTLANLREIATTAYFNVPRGFEMLLPALGADRAFARHFFSRLKILFYAAAGLRQQTADAIEQIAVDECGERIAWVTGLGATESAPFAMCTGAMPSPIAGRIGVPVPGVELKVARVGALHEARLRGPNVTPGYWRDAALTAAAFDDEGFYRMGDAVGFIDEADPSRGFTFEGRITEDFKMSTGTWVRVGPLRAAFLAHFDDLVQDVVIAGHEREYVGALVFPSLATCTRLCGVPAESTAPSSPRDILGHASVVAAFKARLSTFAAAHAGSSTRIERLVLLEEPPSLDGREITDKGSINQHAVIARRAALVAQLYGGPGDAILVNLYGKDSIA